MTWSEIVATLAAKYGWTPDVVGELSLDQVGLYLRDGKPPKTSMNIASGEDFMRKLQLLQDYNARRKLQNGGL